MTWLRGSMGGVHVSHRHCTSLSHMCHRIPMIHMHLPYMTHLIVVIGLLLHLRMHRILPIILLPSRWVVHPLPVVHTIVNRMWVIICISTRLNFDSLLFWRIRPYVYLVLLMGGWGIFFH